MPLASRRGACAVGVATRGPMRGPAGMGNVSRGLATGNVVMYTDGSGGPRRDALTRAAWGAAMAVDGPGQEACGTPPPVAFGSVPGAQTAQGAKVWGTCRALAIFGRCASRSICVVTDSAYLMGGASAGCVRQSNPDLWKALAAQGRSCSERGVAVSYRKVRAHTERRQYQEVTQGDSQVRADALGNLQADALAGEGAALLQLPELLIRVATEGEALSCALMGRFIAIEGALVESYGADSLAPRLPRPRALAASVLKERIRVSGHLLGRFGRSLKCSKCGRVVGLSRLSEWLPHNPCPGHQLVREGRLCFASNPRKTAARYLQSRSACGGQGGAESGLGEPALRRGASSADEVPQEESACKAEASSGPSAGLGLDDPEHKGVERHASDCSGSGADADGGASEGPGRQPGEAQTRRGRRGARRLSAPLAAQPRVSRAVAAADAADRVAAEIGVGTRALHLAQSELATLARTAEVTSLGPEVHASHSLAAHRGLRWCRRCGAYAFGRGRGLRALCQGCPTPHGKVVLRRLGRDPPLPPPHTAWE